MRSLKLIPVFITLTLAACSSKENKKLPILGSRQSVEKTVDGKTVVDTIYQTIKKLPILGSRQPVEKTVDGKTVVDTIYQTIPPFSFLNQDSAIVTDKAFDGTIYVADFFFTSCTSICPVMHRNMLKLYNQFKDHPEVKILSHSIDTKYDTPSRLKKYADKLGVKGTQWEFVHGSRDSIYGIAGKNYLVAVSEDAKSPDGFIHQGWFVLVDKEKRLRGAYEGTDADQVDQLIADMETLLDEYKK